MCRNVFPCQQIKNCLSSLYQTPSTAIFASTLFVTKIMCCGVTHDATSSILLNSTNEANTFPIMYNIIRFSRLWKLVSSNLKRSVAIFGKCSYFTSTLIGLPPEGIVLRCHVQHTRMQACLPCYMIHDLLHMHTEHVLFFIKYCCH